MLAKGLDLQSVLMHQCQNYSNDDSTLTLILNLTDHQYSLLIESLIPIKSLQSASSTSREAFYKKGGLLSITSRMLLIDILRGAVEVEFISAIIIMDGEKTRELGLEAFIIALARKSNPLTIIKVQKHFPLLPPFTNTNTN